MRGTHRRLHSCIKGKGTQLLLPSAAGFPLALDSHSPQLLLTWATAACCPPQRSQPQLCGGPSFKLQDSGNSIPSFLFYQPEEQALLPAVNNNEVIRHRFSLFPISNQFLVWNHTILQIPDVFCFSGWALNHIEPIKHTKHLSWGIFFWV